MDRVTEQGEREERKRDETAAVRQSGFALEQCHSIRKARCRSFLSA